MKIKPIWQNKMQFFPSSCWVDSTIWMHYIDADEAYKEKAWWQLHKNFTSNTEQILEVTYQKKRQLYDHRPPISKTIQIRWTRHAGHCWRSKDKLISDILLWTPSHGHASVGQPTRTYPQQLCTDTGCNLEDHPEVMDDKDE